MTMTASERFSFSARYRAVTKAMPTAGSRERHYIAGSKLRTRALLSSTGRDDLAAELAEHVTEKPRALSTTPKQVGRRQRYAYARGVGCSWHLAKSVADTYKTFAEEMFEWMGPHPLWVQELLG